MVSNTHVDIVNRLSQVAALSLLKETIADKVDGKWK